MTIVIQTIAIHGRQPDLGRAELESLYGADNLEVLSKQATGLSLTVSEIDFNRLGGTIKLVKVLTRLPGANFSDHIQYITKSLPEHLAYIPEGKIQFGLSVYGLRTSVRDINAAALTIKKVIKNQGRSVRVIPNKELELNSAQVLHNHLTGPTGMELVLIASGKETWLAQTVNIQDIEAYAARDQARPKRDARVGMLPPKLAQIITNLAVGREQISDLRSQSLESSSDIHSRLADRDLRSNIRLLDPFCGTGVVLQEALLMGYNVYGTDLEPRMIDYSKTNLEWLSQTSDTRSPISEKPSEIRDLRSEIYLEVGDATNHQWSSFDNIAAETYLGRPFSATPSPQILQEVMQDVDTIHRKFLRNVASQTKPGFRMCLAVPAWKTQSGFKHLKILDSLEEIGYNRLKFVHASWPDLIYHRENQIVARELVILIRK